MRVSIVALALLAGGGRGVLAEPVADPLVAPFTASPAAPTHARAWLEAGALMAANAAWYWSHTAMNVEDWDLHWDWESWEGKLTSAHFLAFDTNYFSVNAVTHPVAGLLYYQVARANGYGVLGATLLDFSTAVLWEYVVEFKEQMSINDLIVNTAAGFGGAEPLLQIGRYFRAQRPTPVNRTLAFLFSPFETLHDPDRLRRRPPWHRFTLTAGLGEVRFRSTASVSETTAGLDLQLVSHPGYGMVGEQAGATQPGAWTRVQVRLAMGRDEPESGLPGVRVATTTTLFGHYAQDIAEDGRGWGRLVGAGTGFLYETRRLAREQDRLLVAHLVGPRLELAGYVGWLTLRGDVAAYGDFALVQAHVYGADLPFDPDPPFTTPLRRFGYYYAYGGTLEARLVGETRAFMLDLGLRAHAFGAIDGAERIATQDDAEHPRGISDQRLFARLGITAFPWAKTIGAGVVVEGAFRRGAWEEMERSTSELSSSLQLVVRF